MEYTREFFLFLFFLMKRQGFPPGLKILLEERKEKIEVMCGTVSTRNMWLVSWISGIMHSMRK